MVEGAVTRELHVGHASKVPDRVAACQPGAPAQLAVEAV